MLVDPFGVPLRMVYGILGTVGAVWIGVGYVTFQYPPDYLELSPLWATVFIVSGVTLFMFLLSPNKMTATIAGAGLIGSSIVRGLAIGESIGLTGYWHVALGDASTRVASFSIAGATWLLTALLLWVGFPPMATRILRGE